MRSFIRKFYLIFISLWIVLFGACSSSQPQIYEDSSLLNDEIAQLKCTTYIKEIIAIDGKNTTDIKHSFFTGGPKITLMPGTKSKIVST